MMISPLKHLVNKKKDEDRFFSCIKNLNNGHFPLLCQSFTSSATLWSLSMHTIIKMISICTSLTVTLFVKYKNKSKDLQLGNHVAGVTDAVSEDLKGKCLVLEMLTHLKTIVEQLFYSKCQ